VPRGQADERHLHLNQHLGTPAKFLAILLLPIALAACAGSDDGKPITFTDDRGVSEQPFPSNYRSEILAFMRTYLNNPAGVHDAAMAESDGSYRQPRERAILYVDGRLDRLIENASEPCAGATYTPFPDLQGLTR
jgi:hypothetical protein